MMNTKNHLEKNEINVTRTGAWLIAESSFPLRTLSWAVYGGGFNTVQHVVWRRVDNGELPCLVNPVEFLESRMNQIGIGRGVGLLTSANLDNYADINKDFGNFSARCLATVGMGNALRAGDFPTAANHVGTINIMCHVSVPLSPNAFIEAASVATEARTLAVLESGIKSIRTGKTATGTGTDCTVISAPHDGEERIYAGKHTVLGHLIGASVYEAVKTGIDRWKNGQEKKHAG